MKLTTRLTINDQPAHLVEHDIMLDLNAGGRAALTAQAEVQKGQPITIDVGYNGELRRWFTGYVFDVQPAAAGSVQLLCRELAGVLAGRLPVSMQHATLRNLLAWLSTETGLVFMLPAAADYADRPIPNFTSAGTGYQLLENAGRASRYPTLSGTSNPMATSSWAATPIAAGMDEKSRLTRPGLPARRATSSPCPRCRPCAPGRPSTASGSPGCGSKGMK